MASKNNFKSLLLSGLLVAVGCIFIAGCNSTPTAIGSSDSGANPIRPSWVLNPPTQSGYVYGVGSAKIYLDAAKAGLEAQNNALQDLIGKMQVSVRGSTLIKTRVANSKLDKLIEDEVKSQIPEINLKNAEFIERFVDTKNQYVYVLAQLDREKAAFDIAAQITDIELSLSHFSNVSETLPRLEQWRALKPALKLIEQRKQLSQRFNIVSPNHQSSTIDTTFDSLERRIFALIGNLSIAVNPLNTGANTTSSSVIKALTDAGFSISNSNHPDLSVDLRVTIQSNWRDGTHYVFAEGAATIKDSSDRILSEYSSRAKGTSSVSQELAESRAFEHIGNSIGKVLADTFMEKI
ncbi:MAG: LPP20 family lipoprotein [Pseudomonadales bacterium]|nr:LPP20 family lipoprotein [Pseudomonadales bacterium]